MCYNILHMSTVDRFLSIFENDKLIPEELQESIKKKVALFNKNNCLAVIRESTIRMVKLPCDYMALCSEIQDYKHYSGVCKNFEYSFCIKEMSMRNNYKIILIIFMK